LNSGKPENKTALTPGIENKNEDKERCYCLRILWGTWNF